jgi:hypothetical protein
MSDLSQAITMIASLFTWINLISLNAELRVISSHVATHLPTIAQAALRSLK